MNIKFSQRENQLLTLRDGIASKRKQISQKLKDAKNEIITIIEDEARNGLAFDEETLTVLYKITEADLFVLQKAFTQSKEIGYRLGAEDNLTEG